MIGFSKSVKTFLKFSILRNEAAELPDTRYCMFIETCMVQVGKYQENAQSERKPHSIEKPRREKTKMTIRYLYLEENIS